MLGHMRANLWLLVLTLLIFSVLYPLALWGIGRLPPLRDKAQGSLIVDGAGKLIGSRLIAQPFTGDEFFQPRPSAASYNAMASSGSNWGASNYRLRDRVARALGPLVRYDKGAENLGKKPGDGIQEDLVAWFAKDMCDHQPGIVAQWANAHSGLAEDWIKATGDALKDQYKAGGNDKTPNEAFVLQWQADFLDLFAAWTQSNDYGAWKKQNPVAAAPANADLVRPFFQSFSRKYPGEWPRLEDYETKDKGQRKRLGRVKQDIEIQSVFFHMWRQAHPDVPLEPVPADMVMASGSGLDPHITLDNARYQLKYRVAAARADKLIAAQAEPMLKVKGEGLTEKQTKEVLAEVRRTIEAKLGGTVEDKIKVAIAELLDESKEAPLAGLAGVALVNVLEVNIALEKRMAAFTKMVQ